MISKLFWTHLCMILGYIFCPKCVQNVVLPLNNFGLKVNMKLISPKSFTPGDKKETAPEVDIENIEFDIFKNNNRTKPTDKKQILIIGCFSEFGCEIVGNMYCIPEILKKSVGKYTIGVGWHGREYLYRHLFDEFWEIKEEHMWLREYARAFHNESKNLKTIERKLTAFGNVIPSDHLGRLAVGTRCETCGLAWGSVHLVQQCRCGSTNITQSLFANAKNRKGDALRIPHPSDEKKKEVQKWLGKRPVGVFARARKCYGRNLQPEFYISLVKSLENKGYTPIWLGEKQSTLPCPVDHIVDFSRMPEARDLEMTLAIISQLKFTVQFWTASTRLAAIMGTPYILFESPDQIWGRGQEGYRINLCSFGPKKLAVCHYQNVFNDNAASIELVERCIDELEAGDESVVYGLLESEVAVRDMAKNHSARVGIG